MKKILVLIFYVLLATMLFGQARGIISGKVVDKTTQEVLPGVNIIVPGTNYGTSTDKNGKFEISSLEPGNYRIKISFIGYTTVTKTDLMVNSARPVYIDVELVPDVIELEGVTVVSALFNNDPTELTSTKTFSYEEIRRAPGGFEDVVRALSVLPGVARQSAGRNDLVVRGGAPSENLFVVDGFVVPNINHFGNLGATGGPLSFVNLDFVQETTFSTGGFSSKYGNKLSSVLKIDLRNGRSDKLGGKATVSASQFGLNLEGPVSNNSSFIFSVRRSYLDFIFNAAGFNFVPEYWDALTKYDYEFDTRNKLSFLFIGAFDKVKFNNEEKEDIYDNARILGSNQNQYVTGVSYKHLFNKGFYTLGLSRNFVDYDGFQKDTLQNPIFTNKSSEAENALKFDLLYQLSDKSELSIGASGTLVEFNADMYFPQNYVTTFGEVLPKNNIFTEETYTKSGAYIQYSNMLFNRIRVNIGGRIDYFDGINDNLYFSPRFSLGYIIDEVTNINFSTGIYQQNPSYIWLTAFNQNKELKAIRADQYILGIERLLREDIKVKLEGFYKDYSNYPASETRPYIVLANTGAGYQGSDDNFSSFGLERLVSDGKGFARGIEFSMQKKSAEVPHYALLSVTYSESFFEALDGVSRAGAYDQKWILSLSGGYIFNKKWEAAFKFRYATGSPYTPYENDGTQLVGNFLSQRFDPIHSLDVRVDRKWDFDGFALITYVDIQNIYNNTQSNSVRWDYYKMEVEEGESIGLLPSIGVSLEF